jgi:pimeloyl-ACP methyl ester carboxylesterase
LPADKGLGTHIREWIELVAEHVDGRVIADCGHFLPEERPEEVTRAVLELSRARSAAPGEEGGAQC